jgi:hypothetical protein
MLETWLQIFSLVLANAGLMIWFRTESRNDWRHMDASIKAIHEESRNDWRHMDNKLDLYMKAIHEEMKDFHDKLCRIEERNKKDKL